MEKDREKLLELLSEQVIFGLDENESAELERLKRRYPDWEDDSFETAATVISLSKLPADEELPAHLRDKISMLAEDFFSQKDGITQKNGTTNDVGATPANSEISIIETEPAQAFGWNWLGWAVAAVALVAFGISVWFLQNQPTEEIAKVPTPTATPTPTMNEKLNQLLASNDSIKAKFDAMVFETFKGDVVWNTAEQKGYIRVSGLPVNDKSKSTYQFWIFDAVQGEKTPVSGGTFDIDETGEVIIPINADVKVSDPKAFAVTVEKPGGVVVSKQERVAGIAKVTT